MYQGCICCRSICSLGQFVPTQVNLLQHIAGQFDFFFLLLLLQQTKNIFGTFDLLFILLLSYSPTIPSLLSQHPNLYSFYLNAYLGSLEPQTFGFPLDSGPDAIEPCWLGCKFHYFCNYIYIVVVINFFKLFKSDILIKENIPPIITLQYMYLCPNYIQINLTVIWN